MSRSLIRKTQLHPDINDLVGQYGSGYFISSELAVYITGNQIISGDKTFIATTNTKISGSSPTTLVTYGNLLINKSTSASSTQNPLEVYQSGNFNTHIKINNPSTGLLSNAGIELTSPGNNVTMFTTPNTNGSQFQISGGSPFTTFQIQNTGTRRLLISGNRVLIGNTIQNNPNGAIFQIQDGITFPAIQAPRTEPNTLDDYEEGAWIPTLKGDGIAGGASFSTRTGYYIKIGRNVNMHGRVTLSSTGTISGNLFIDTLPFIPVGSPNSQGTISFNFFNALATPLVNIYGHTASTPNGRINLFKLTAAATTSNARMRHTDLTNTTDLIFAGFYLALE
jgi:hypothetical protein